MNNAHILQDERQEKVKRLNFDSKFDNELLDCIHGTRNVHVKHDTKSLDMFNHYRYMKAEGIACHCNLCEFVIRLLRAYENGDPYISKKMILMARRYK